jgi:hypothetical protein
VLEVEDGEKETTTKDSIEYLSGTILRNKNVDGGNASFIHAPIQISASAEEVVPIG